MLASRSHPILATRAEEPAAPAGAAAPAAQAEAGGGGGSGDARETAAAPDLSPAALDARLRALEASAAAQAAKLAEVETMAKRRGAMMQMVMQYGAGFALWYATVWVSMWMGVYLLLELELISWQESLRPLFQSLGLDSYVERVDPSVGNLILAFVVNELAEPVRFPLVLATGAPLLKFFSSLRKGGKGAAAGAGAGAAKAGAGAA